MWQGQQRVLVGPNGTECDAKIALAVGDQAVCYTHSSGPLLCAGRVFEQTYGPAFTDTGLSHVDQLLLSFTANAENGNGIVAVTGARVYVMGKNTIYGRWGQGDTADLPAFTLWGTFENVAAVTTGTFDRICAKLTDGSVWCSGYGSGMTPTFEGEADWVWESDSGDLSFNDFGVWRVSPFRAECVIRQSGLQCGVDGPPHGATGHVVAGGRREVEGGAFDAGSSVCWLDDEAVVRCGAGAGHAAMFAPGRVLFLAMQYYTDSMCAVYDDGSLWCVGSNQMGKLGVTGASLSVATEVQPPGSVRIGCGL